MWVMKLRIMHDCVIGSRCKKFQCTSLSLPLNHWSDKKYNYASHRHTLEGDKKNIQKFIRDLKKDPRVVSIESSNNTLFVVEKRRNSDIPTAHYNQKMFFVKPVNVDNQGFEVWEVAALDKKVLMDFLSELENEKLMDVKLEMIENIKLDNIYFPKLMPNLSEKQKECFHMAVSSGYYSYPRKTNLHRLAKVMKISVATFQEHLRKAEQKLMPTFS